MSFDITNDWIVDTMRKNTWCLNTEVFVYPDGLDSKELAVAEGEKVVASITDVLYLSRMAVYCQGRQGDYDRIPWSEIDDIVWSLRKVNGQTVQAASYKTVDGRKVVAVMPFTFVPFYFSEVQTTCFAELSPGGKRCKLPGPTRLQPYARAVDSKSPWLEDVQQSTIAWIRELACSCGVDQGYAFRYLGDLRDNGLIADGESRQRLVGQCKDCGDSLEVFDSYRHGYNAVICGERASEPAAREAVTEYQCRCGENRFSIGVVALYDVDSEELRGFRKDKRSEAYGWFAVYGTCLHCEAISQVIDYETA